MKYTFNSAGKITAIMDRNSTQLSFLYDESNNLTTVVDSGGRSLSIAYDTNNMINAVTDPQGNTYNFMYLPFAFGKYVLFAISAETREQRTFYWYYDYDANGYMISKTDPQGNTTRYYYGPHHKVVKSIDAAGNIRKIQYPSTVDTSLTTVFTEGDGGVSTYQYDPALAELLQKTDPQGNITSYTYDQSGNMLSRTDPAGGVTTYSYDTDGNVTSVTDAEGNTTAYTYDTYGQATSITDPSGQVRSYSYDDRGNLTSIVDGSGATTTYEYDSKGNVTKIIDAAGQTTNYTYDQHNYLTAIADPTGTTTRFTYDAVGNMISQTDAAGNTSHFFYDSRNQLITVTDPQGNTSTYTYDLMGNRTSTIDANGNATRYEYNSNGQATKVTDPLGNSTVYTYGDTGCPSCGGGGEKLTSITDAAGNTTSYVYDNLGRLILETDPSGNTIVFAYDANGNLISKTDASGVVINYAYDALNRLTGIVYPDSSQDVSYTYDDSGKVLTMTDQSGLSTFTYDDSGRMVYETHTINDMAYDVSYTYTATGALSSLTYPDGRTVSYGLDSYGRTSNISEAKDGRILDVIKTISYNPSAAVSAITYGNGLVTTKEYDVKGALSNLSMGNLRQLSYSRDDAGNITAITDNLAPSKTKTFSYDGLYRLTQATGPWGTISYAYDPVGNRTVETSGAGMTNYAYTTKKLLSSTGVKTFAFGYDNNGNTISENQRQYIYNQNQRLIKTVENANVVGEYLYNGNGQRVIKTVGGKTTYFIYDQSGNLIEEVDGEGKPVSDYIYLGGTPIGRVDMNKDTAPPMTTASVGSPNYQNGAVQYISASALISLSASDPGDAPSGLDYTEYKLDDEALWTRYAGPFNLGGNVDGNHTISYRSMDKAGNLEDTKILAVMLDTTAPISGISASAPESAAGDVLFIGGSTPITITASDAGSGMGKTECSVDGGTYDVYFGPFTLSSYQEGLHVIACRSTDNVLNIEADKTLSVTMDKSSPVATISASDPLIPGVVNAVSPNTVFSLTSTDSLSGMKSILFDIDGRGWSSYSSPFSLTGAGQHIIGYKAIDNVGNEETQNETTVRLVVLDATQDISAGPIVLAGAWGSTPSTQTAIDNLATILTSSGLTYHIPQTQDDFTSSLRGGRFNTYLLVDFKDQALVDELREAVNYGDGLVYIKTLPDAVPALEDVFGVKFNGMSTNKDMLVSLAASPISAGTTLQCTGKAVKTTITSVTAQSMGMVEDKKDAYPVVVSNQYGQGKVVLFAFDLLNSPDQSAVSSLFVNSINYVLPARRDTRPLEEVPIRINLENSTEPADVQVLETIPANTSADAISPTATQSDNTIAWQSSLAADEKKTLGYWLNLPDLAGDYRLGTELRYSNQGDYRLYGYYSLTVTVAVDSADLLKKIISDLQILNVTKADADHVTNALADLNLIKDYAGVTKTDAQNNINHILSALSELGKVSVDVSAIRLELDELLKIWQAKWNLAPTVVSYLGRYRLVYETDARKMDKQVAATKKPILVASTGPLTGLLNAPTTDVLYFYHTDHLGTPILITNTTGNKVWEGEFLPFGEAYSISGTVTNNLRFPGQYYDAETGLAQNGKRDYDSTGGRYIEKDPIGLKGDINPYVYAKANPLRLTDPRGLAVVYDCYRPLDHGLWFLQYHRYLLIDGAGWGLTTADGSMGLTSAPGKLEPDNATSGWGIHCVPVQVTDCQKQCLKTEVDKDQKNPPNYNIHTFNCQAWVSNIFSRCPNK